MECTAWTAAEIEILKTKYSECGTNIAELLVNHTVNAIYSKAKRLGLRKKRAPMSEEDKVLLRTLYPINGSNIPELLSRYSVREICSAAHTLGLHSTSESRQRWSAEDENVLREHFPEQGANIPGLREKYTMEAIQSKATRMGLKLNRDMYNDSEETATWSSAEDALLRAEYPSKGSNIAGLLNKYSTRSIRARAGRLGLRVESREWARSEDEIIREYGHDCTRKELMMMLPGRSETAISIRARELGVYRKEAIASTITNSNIVRTCYAYRGTDGLDYFIILCAGCGRCLILPRKELDAFVHGSICEARQVPLSFIPDNIRGMWRDDGAI